MIFNSLIFGVARLRTADSHVCLDGIGDEALLVRQVMRKILERAGHEVVEAGNGVDALDLLDADWPDVVVTDVQMPRMNGLEFMIEARKRANNLEDAREKAIAYCDKVKPFLEKIRYHADKLELLVDDELWPLPKMRELMFTR